MSILCAKVDCTKRCFAGKRRTLSFSPQGNFQVCTVINNDVQRVLELGNFVSITNHLNFSLFIRLKNTMPLDHFPNTVFPFRKCGVLCWDLRLVPDGELPSLILQRCYCSIVKLVKVMLNNWSSRCGQYSDHKGDMVALYFDVKWDPNSAQDFSFEGYVDNLGAPRINDATALICSVDGYPLRLIILRNDLVLRLQRVLIDDLYLPCLRMPQEAGFVFQEIRGANSYLWDEALCFNRHSKHVLSDSFQVHYQHHVVELREARDKLNFNFGLLTSLKSPMVVSYVKL